jgi:hypothetical protein
MIVTGNVKAKDGSPEVGAKVFVSDSQGKITPLKIGAITDSSGKFQLDITNRDGNYLTVTNVAGDLTKAPINEAVTNYSLDLSTSKTTTLPDVTVTAPKKEPVKTTAPKTSNNVPPKKPNWVLIGISGIGLALLFVGGYYVLKGKK